MDELEDCMPTTGGCTDSGNASESDGEIPPTQQHCETSVSTTSLSQDESMKTPALLTMTYCEFGLVWARNAPNQYRLHWEAMQSTDYMHTFVIPVDLTRSLQAALATARKEQYTPDELDANTKKQGIVLDLVATIDQSFGR
ncbi:hypothetical protein GQ600_12259 [Phytophthora cactorum]|nr:hypothetical protein GQ600_12259 [Phytophthora cactorum]